MKYVNWMNNPCGRNVGDCTVRAIGKATGKDWEEIYTALCLQGFMMCDMPSANSVWGAYLRGAGYNRHIADTDCTVSQFADEHPQGTYILALSGHVVCVIDGSLYDSWNSGNEIVLYYFERG